MRRQAKAKPSEPRDKPRKRRSGPARSAQVTQSTRFNEAQMAEISRACEAKRWSVSQLMLVATLEKALAINQMAERGHEVRMIVNGLVGWLLGRFPKLKCAGLALDDPEGPWAPWPRRNGYLEADRALELPGSLYAQYFKETRTVEVRDLSDEREDEDSVPLFEVAPVSPSPEEVQRIAQCIQAIGPVMGDLLMELYQFRLTGRPGEKLKLENQPLKTVDELLGKGPVEPAKGD